MVSKTKKQTSSVRKLMIVVQQLNDHLLPQHDYDTFLKDNFERYCYQLEKGQEGGRIHYQTVVIPKIKSRPQTIVNKFKSYCKENSIHYEDGCITVQPLASTYDEGVKYCTKTDTRLEGPWSSHILYLGNDLDVLERKPFKWQVELFNIFLYPDKKGITPSDARTIHWVNDSTGCSGKSLFTKYLCFNYPSCVKISFSTATQLRKSLARLGQRQMYVVDIPRTLGREDSIDDLISVLEDLKNGHITSSMYGEYDCLFMNAPHVLIFSNTLPNVSRLSKDRWKIWTIERDGSLFRESIDSINYVHD
jgi:hypothetical protein